MKKSVIAMIEDDSHLYTKGYISGSTYPRLSDVPWSVPHIFHVAIVGCVKPSISEEVEGIDVDLLRQQHESLVRVLRELNIRIIEVDLQGSYHTYLLLENIAVACSGIVFLPKPRTVADEKNAVILKKALKECSQVIVEQRNPLAKVCGYDVLFTGLELIVGLCDTTNEAGANELADAFADYPVTAFKMPDGADHIKNYITMAGNMLMAIGPSDAAFEILDNCKRRVMRAYSELELAEDFAANCLFANKTLIHQAIEQIPKSFKIFIQKTKATRRSICFSEFNKLRAGLSSPFILTKKVI